MGYIYKITNMQNNKIYVGKTTTCIRDRFSKHVYEANTPNTKGYSFILHKAMRKYGIENFQIEQIEDVDNDLINEREIYWIKFYNSMIPNGYNMTLGREGSVKIDYEIIYHLWDEGKSIAQIAKMVKHSIPQLKAILTNYPNFNNNENNQRTINATKKRVGQYNKDTNELIAIYDSIKDAAEAVSVDRSCISRCCSGKKKSCRGFLWKFMATGTITSEEVTKIYG